MYEQDYERLLEEQKQQATGMRLEILNKQGEGEKKLVSNIILPVLKTTKGLILEYEFVTITGVRAYIDSFFIPLWIGFEGEGFIVHAQNNTRSRFDFERNKIRSISVNHYDYFPFSWDEMDKKPELCQRSIYEKLGRRMSNGGIGTSYSEVSLYEREVIRYALRLGRPIRMADVCECLQSSHDFCLKVIRDMIAKKLLISINPSNKRNHEYILVEGVSKILW
jgi:hypothetical protein